jgi:type IV pilus assembly protein PilA
MVTPLIPNSSLLNRPCRLLSSWHQRHRGFTLIELMVVVMIMGVLATLAGYGVRKYVLEAKKAEAGSMLSQIRTTEEAYKDEMFVYLGLGNFTVWHPTNDPGGVKYGWHSQANAMRVVFDQLGVMPNGAVEYSYAVVSGDASDSVPSLPLRDAVNIPTPLGPWYVAMAKGDLDNDGSYTYAITYSGNAVVHIENYF